MRIVAGTAGRTVLVAPKGHNTRPTSDIARESLFNIISANIVGARFLDLFCGSGAVGLEALSRGAAEVVLVDSQKLAIQAALQNLNKTKLCGAQVMESTAQRAIAKLSSAGRIFDFIFLDPPYDTDLLEQTMQQLCNTSLLANTGMIIAETDSKLAVPPPPAAFTLVDSRKYGRTSFLLYSINSHGGECI